MAKGRVLAARSRPRTRRAPTPTAVASRQATAAPARSPQPKGMAGNVALQDVETTPADVDRHPAHEGGGAESADAGEGHLSERQLPAPPREDGDRRGTDGEGQDLRVGELLGGLPEEKGESDAGAEGEDRSQLRESPHPPDLSEAFGDGPDPGSELE